MKKYRLPPTYMVGWEGIFGFVMMASVLAVFQAFGGKPDDVVVTLEQIGNCWTCGLATLLVLCVVPIFNGAANTITKELSAATRMVLDALRNIVVWTITMSLSAYFNESFDWLQVFGFALLVVGGSVYRRLLAIPHPFFNVASVRHELLDNTELTAQPQSGYSSLQQDGDIIDGVKDSSSLEAVTTAANVQGNSLVEPSPS
jgi:hypothetical protein